MQDSSEIVVPKNEQAVTAFSHSLESEGAVAWSKASILKLIQLQTAHQHLFEDRHYKKKSVWEMVALGLHKDGFNYSWRQVENKWKSLTKKYRDTVDHNAKHGHICPRRCPFFTELSLVYSYTSQFANQSTLQSNLPENSGTTVKTMINKNNNVHQQIVAVVSHSPLPQHKTIGMKRSLGEPTADAGSSFQTGSPLIIAKKKKYNHLSANKESDIEQILHMLQVMNEDRKKQERERMEKLERMHQEKISLFKELLTVLKTSVNQKKSKECTCTGDSCCIRSLSSSVTS